MSPRHPGQSEPFKDVVKADLPHSRRDIVPDGELVKRGGNKWVENASEEVVMEIGQPSLSVSTVLRNKALFRL